MIRQDAPYHGSRDMNYTTQNYPRRALTPVLTNDSLEDRRFRDSHNLEGGTSVQVVAPLSCYSVGRGRTDLVVGLWVVSRGLLRPAETGMGRYDSLGGPDCALYVP